ncbi:MAG: non-ribosomal peptide synthase [Nocardia sp.]|uniref:fatty acyl-AMP ligase n=1 Tax=Nocardia sp. TaxID=1821 RepID=UPI0026353C16|nr:fatty acyl-AMP ligase [Nocardia sp.]MCU1645728.1 non-ribosomal peptide synthase [Nocardia sp.]
MSYEQISGHPSTLADILVSRAAEQPGRIGYTFVDGRGHREVEDYALLLNNAVGLATRLQEISAPGDRILLLCPPGLDMIHAFFACLLIRRVAVPLYVPTSQRHSDTVAAITRDSGAVAVIAPQSAASVARDLLGWPDEKILDSAATQGGSSLQLLDRPLPSENDIAHLQYTSGSTGYPKGVVVRHRNLMHNLECLQRSLGYTGSSSAVHWLPPSHDMGLILGILSPLFVGYPVTLMSPLTFLRNPLSWLQEISENTNTTAGGPNLAYGICAERVSRTEAEQLDLSHWDIAFVGAEPVNPTILRAFADKFAGSGFRPESFIPGYGLAEATLYVSGGPAGSGLRTCSFANEELEKGFVMEKPNGRELVDYGPVRAGAAAMVDPRTLQRSDPGRVGEIWLSGESVTSGYWNKPEESERTFSAEIADEGGTPYLRTGDLGFMVDGHLFVCGRLKEVMIINGRNLFPQDIEWSIESSHPSLHRGGCAAVSIEIHGEERLIVIQEIDDEIAADSVTALEESIKSAVSRDHGVSLYRVIFVGKGKVLKTTSGKIRRSYLRHLYADEIESRAI